MERISFEIERQDVLDELHARAEAHGRSVEEELAALVAQTYVPKTRDSGGNWVDELIALADGADLRIPTSRAFVRYAPDFPQGMDPLPGESFVDHITRISRPGFDLHDADDDVPHTEPRL